MLVLGYGTELNKASVDHDHRVDSKGSCDGLKAWFLLWPRFRSDKIVTMVSMMQPLAQVHFKEDMLQQN